MVPASEDDTSTISAKAHGHASADGVPVKLDEDEPAPAAKRFSWGCVGRAAAALVIVGLAAYIVIDSLTGMHLTRWYETFLAWLRDNIAVGALCYAGLYAVATVVFFPGSVLTLGAGFTFASALGQGLGIAVATGVVFVGASVGATLAFFLGRYVLRDTASRWAAKYRVLAAVDRAVRRSGLRLMLLLRLSPVVPFSAFNYVAAATGVRARDFLVAHLALVPGTAAYCYFGSLLSSARETAMGQVQDPALQWALLGVGVVATVAALVLITLYARRELRAALEDDGGEGGGAAAVDVVVVAPAGAGKEEEASAPGPAAARS